MSLDMEDWEEENISKEYAKIAGCKSVENYISDKSPNPNHTVDLDEKQTPLADWVNE